MLNSKNEQTEKSAKIRDFFTKKKAFEKQFAELYLAGYSATRMVEMMEIKIKPVTDKESIIQRDNYQRRCQAWFSKNRKKLKLTRKRPDFKNNPDLSHISDYIERNNERNRLRQLQRIPLQIAKLEKRKNKLIDNLNKLEAELRDLNLSLPNTKHKP